MFVSFARVYACADICKYSSVPLNSNVFTCSTYLYDRDFICSHACVSHCLPHWHPKFACIEKDAYVHIREDARRVCVVAKMLFISANGKALT